jgi:hypothetical protein
LYGLKFSLTSVNRCAVEALRPAPLTPDLASMIKLDKSKISLSFWWRAINGSTDSMLAVV